MRLADHVVEKLLALVQARGLQPGQRLPAERQLAEELGCRAPRCAKPYRS
jgi:GntR family L-lactate dehydrogenase operon transcriptional regulator